MNLGNIILNERRPAQKVKNCMCHLHKASRSDHGDRAEEWLPGPGEREDKGATTNGYRVSFGSDEKNSGVR